MKTSPELIENPRHRGPTTSVSYFVYSSSIAMNGTEIAVMCLIASMKTSTGKTEDIQRLLDKVTLQSVAHKSNYKEHFFNIHTFCLHAIINKHTVSVE